MDTFFFIEVEVVEPTEASLRLGPYATFSSAAEILVDCMPIILEAETLSKNPVYKEASISEWIVYKGAWEQLAIPVTEITRN
jgi:hypothetical protein